MQYNVCSIYARWLLVQVELYDTWFLKVAQRQLVLDVVYVSLVKVSKQVHCKEKHNEMIVKWVFAPTSVNI